MLNKWRGETNLFLHSSMSIWSKPTDIEATSFSFFAWSKNSLSILSRSCNLFIDAIIAFWHAFTISPLMKEILRMSLYWVSAHSVILNSQRHSSVLLSPDLTFSLYYTSSTANTLNRSVSHRHPYWILHEYPSICFISLIPYIPSALNFKVVQLERSISVRQ